MKKIYYFLFYILIIFIIPDAAFAQFGWNHLGPFGGDVRVMTSDSLNIYTGTAGGGVYKSSNSGASWTYLGLASCYIRDILPLSSGEIYAGADNGLFKKSASVSYFSKVQAFGNSTIRSLAYKSPDLYAGTDNGIYKSTDNGSTWNIAGLSSSAIRCITIAPSGDIFLGTNGQGIYKSTNNGTTWISIGLSNYLVRSIHFAANGSIYSGTYGGIFKSTNNGSAWTLTGLEQTDIPQVTSNSNGQLFASAWDGVYTSTNNGTTWSMLGFSESITWTIFNDKSNNLFIGRDGEGIYKSTTGGATWYEANNGLTAARIWAISFDNGGRIYTGASGGAFRSTNNGTSWSKIFESTIAGRVWSVLINTDNDVLFGTSKGIFRSTDQGVSWTNIGISDQSVKAIKKNSLGYLFAGTANGVYRSTDNGNTWTLNVGGLGSTSVSDIEITSNNIILAAVGGGSAVYKSTNNGLSWSASNSGISSSSATDLFIDKKGNIYVTAGNTAYKSNNNGSAWYIWGNGFTYTSSIYVDSLGHSFLGNIGDGIYYSPDSSMGWLLANIGPENLNISCLTADKNGFIYTGTYGGSIYRSINSFIPVELVSFTSNVKNEKVLLSWKTSTELNNKGFMIERKSFQDWEEIAFITGAGTTSEPINYYYDDKNLDPGKYSYRLKQVDYDGKFRYSKIITAEVLPNGFKLFQNYPNPFNPLTTIKFTVPSKSKVQLKVYDFLGKEIKELFNNEAEEGKLYEVEFTTEGLSSGIYYYKLIAGDKSEIRKMIFMK